MILTDGGGSSSPAKEGDEITTIGRERVDGQPIGNSDVKSNGFSKYYSCYNWRWRYCILK